jgi:hypothetical protein
MHIAYYVMQMQKKESFEPTILPLSGARRTEKQMEDKQVT